MNVLLNINPIENRWIVLSIFNHYSINRNVKKWLYIFSPNLSRLCRLAKYNSERVCLWFYAILLSLIDKYITKVHIYFRWMCSTLIAWTPNERKRCCVQSMKTGMLHELWWVTAIESDWYPWPISRAKTCSYRCSIYRDIASNSNSASCATNLYIPYTTGMKKVDWICIALGNRGFANTLNLNSLLQEDSIWTN